ncbi:MAG: CHAD domain-containing protein, partial [Planctomycetota bacterium]
MDLPPDLLLRTPEEGARRIALAFLGEARAASLRLDDADDVEALHDFRVAIRRLRSTLRAWRPELASSISKKQRRALKDLQAATGGGRDAEVALAWLERERPSVAPTHRHGLEWMVKRLVRRRREAMGRVTGDVRREFDRWDAALRNRLSRMRVEHHLAEESTTPAFAAVAAIRLREHMQDLLDHLLRIEEPGDRELCHDTRIRCKRLRYLL